MFKTLWEKKQQLDNFKRLQKSIDWVIIHSSNDYCDISINCNYDIVDLKIKENYLNSRVISLSDIEKSVIESFNKAKKKATEVLQEKSREIFK